MQGKVYMKYDLFLWIFVAHVKVVELHVPVPLLFASQRKVLVINLISCTCKPLLYIDQKCLDD